MEDIIQPMDLKKLIMLFNYQYRTDKGEEYFDPSMSMLRSKRTNRIRYIYYEGCLIATLKPTDGHLVLSAEGAKRFLLKVPKPTCRVVVDPSVEQEIILGKNVYARHALSCDPDIRPADEVFVVNNNDGLIAIGRAILNGHEITAFKYGQAVRTRKGIGDHNDEAENES